MAQHSIWAGGPPTAEPTLADDNEAIVTGASFYSLATVWYCRGGGWRVPASAVGSLPASVTIRLHLVPLNTNPNFTAAPDASGVATVAAGWIWATWTPVQVPVGMAMWVSVNAGEPYLATAVGLMGTAPIQASDASDLYLSEADIGAGVQPRGYFDYAGGSGEGQSQFWFATDVLVTDTPDTPSGGSEAEVVIGSEGLGTKAASGASEAGVVIGATGAGDNPDDVELIPDRLGPLMLDLLDCAENAMNGAGTPVGRAHLVAGLDAVWDDCCAADDAAGGAGGTLWVRVIETYPTAGQGSPYPQRDVSTRSCHPFAWAAQLAVGVVRCTPTVDDNGVAPSPDAITLSALEMTRDRATLETAIRCCFANPDGAPEGMEEGKVILFGWVPLGANGGCAGGEWTVYVLIRSCACPDDPPRRS
jgi:hypothetical protein